MPLPAIPFSLLAYLQGNLPGVELRAKLYTNAIDLDVGHALGDFVEANYSGYASQVVDSANEPTVTYPVQGSIASRMMVWMHSGADLSMGIVRGLYIVARYPDGSEALVGFSPLAAERTVDAEALPFGMTVFLSSMVMTV